jgi:pyruvate formate-lyase/glycerol dehydratase family glycyl radical enzyme
MNERIKFLREKCLSSKPEIFVERALLVTEAYKETTGKPIIIQRALVLKKVLEEMTIYIEENELIVGNQSPKLRCPPIYPETGANWIIKELNQFSKRKADPVVITKENKKVLKKCLSFWQEKSLDASVSNLISNHAKKAVEAGLITIGGVDTALGNIALDYPKVLKIGLEGIITEIDDQLNQFQIKDIKDINKYYFWEAAKIACQAVIHFAVRYSKKAEELAQFEKDPVRKKELCTITKICERVPAKPACSFWEAIQSLWFIILVLHIESDPHAILYGRFDQYMFPYYQNDIQEGSISDEEVKELLECIWIKATSLLKLRDERSSKAFAGFPLFQNLTIGGQTPSGEDACNSLTKLILEAIADVKVTQPSVALRFHNKMLDEILLKTVDVIKLGLGYPAIMNDNVIIPKQLIRGATLEEARDYCTNCVETDIPGKTDSRAHSGYVNFPKCLLLALNNGIDFETGEQLGPRTGEYIKLTTFNDLMIAYKKQLKYCIDTIVEAYNIVDSLHAALLPEPFLSSLLHDCNALGKSRQEGGARYNFSGIFGVGLAIVADSLAAIKKFVFDEKLINMNELILSLKNNFKDQEKLRQILLNKAPKYGNNNDYVDLIAKKCANYFCEEVQKNRCIRGGNYIAELHSVATHVLFGEKTTATPDGRKAYSTLSDGISPAGGRDIGGPTATINSVLKVDHMQPLQGLLLNLKFSPSVLAEDFTKKKFADFIRSYCFSGGHHIQFNIISNDTLRKAKKSPEKYRDLLIRVAGYSAFFVELNENTQNEIIARTEQIFR